MRVFVKRDLDGFCGLFVDNLVQVLLIVGLGIGLCGMSPELIYGTILPGTAISLLVGNLFYAWQAHRLARKTGRDDVTALPFGVNTPSLIVYIFFVIKPEFDRTGDPIAAWKMGLLACLGSGIIELVGAFLAGPIRRATPRAALLSTLAGIAIGFISMTFALQIFTKPLISMLPLAIVLVGLFSRASLPLGLPSGFVAVLVGTGIAWLMVPLQGVSSLPTWMTFGAASAGAVQDSLAHIKFSPPIWCWPMIQEAFEKIEHWLPLLSVVIPMGLFNVVGSLQNIESAEAAGDRYPTTPSMFVNGLSTIIAALFGSCYPTTIYIGHPGWKALGARAGYSTLNGFVMVGLALFGLLGVVAAVIPIEAGAAIVLWIGIIITAQAFRATPEEHAPAVAVGLFPAIAAWGATVMMGTLGVAQGRSLLDLVKPAPPVAVVSVDAPPAEALPAEAPATASANSAETAAPETAAPLFPPDGTTANAPSEQADTPESPAPPAVSPPRGPDRSLVEVSGFLVHGMLVMERGYIFTCMILAAASACLIDRNFTAAAIWMLIAAAFTGLGVMHAYQVANPFALDYLFRFSPPAEGGYFYRADDILVGYLLCAIFFFVIGKWSKGRPLTGGH